MAPQQRAKDRSAAAPPDLTRPQIESLEAMYGNRYLLEPAPDHKLPKSGMSAQEAMGLVEQEMVLDGLPARKSRDLRDHLDGARGRACDTGIAARQLH